jgi:DNA-binding NtrC family response regulator
MKVALIASTQETKDLVLSIGQELGFVVFTPDAVKTASRSDVAAVIVELSSPVDNATWATIRQCTATDSGPAVVALVPHGSVALMRRLLRSGVTDVLFLPLNPSELHAEFVELSKALPALDPEKRSLLDELGRTSLVGRNSLFRRAISSLQQAASCDANALLLGETGTGKEMFARAIHTLSRRASEPFVAVNCTSLSSQLLESELFGHIKGSFTGAEKDRDGRFAAAKSGTLFLDEIGDIEPSLQMKLLRVVETREYQRVGDNASRLFTARLISATSVDVDSAIKTGRFRADLLGRLNQFRIELPSLRERTDDVPLLIRHFLDKHSHGRLVELSQTAFSVLVKADYPMNVRQLENVIVGAVARSFPANVILPKHRGITWDRARVLGSPFDRGGPQLWIST